MYKIESLISADKNNAGYDTCTGCGVCKLSCPVWQKTHDTSLTLYGRIQAIQGGATIEDLSRSLMACLLCGACQPSCPMEMDTVQLTIQLRTMLAGMGKSPLARRFILREKSVNHPALATEGNGPIFFLPGRAIRNNHPIFQRILSLINHNGSVLTAVNDASHIIDSIEAGFQPSKEIISEFIKGFEEAKEIIVAEGLMYRFIRARLPGLRIRSLGEVLLGLKRIQKALKATDLYLIETRAFNSDYHRLVTVYDRIRIKTGCRMNMDLQRIAIPTGASCLQNRYGMIILEPADQARRIMDGLTINRIVVESMDDMAIFKEVSEYPVIHVSELL